MTRLTVTLVADGTSDRVLLPIIQFLLDEHSPLAFEAPQFASDLPAPSLGLHARLSAALELFPCRLLVIHRDAEASAVENRLKEMAEAMEHVAVKPDTWIPVVPVRMTEAWLLADEAAIRRAAGNPSGNEALGLPAIGRLESVADPKRLLRDALEKANHLSRRRGLDFNGARQRVGALMDCRLLRRLPSFCCFESRLVEALNGYGQR